MAQKAQRVPYPLRMTEELKRRVTEEAVREGRSFNSEVSTRIRERYEMLDAERAAVRRAA